MCAKNHLLILSSFLDIWENVEWPRFFGPPCTYWTFDSYFITYLLNNLLGHWRLLNIRKGNNTLEIFMTNKTSSVNRCEPIPGIGGHETAVFLDAHILARKQKNVKITTSLVTQMTH